MNILLHSGIAGLLVVLCFVSVVIAGAVGLPLTRSKRLLGWLTMLSLLPVVIGLCGTMAGYHQIAGAIEGGLLPATDGAQSIVEHGRQEARYATYLGAGATLILLLGAGLGSLLVAPRPSDPAGG